MPTLAAANEYYGEINTWDTSRVTGLAYRYYEAPLTLHNTGLHHQQHGFNRPIGNWDVSGFTDMKQMFFNNQDFNQDLNSWDVSRVTDMSNLFSTALSFNQPINSWDTSNVKDMSGMFYVRP